jgi:hypothetical protein
MATDGRHPPVGKLALQKHAVPFLLNKPMSTAERLRALLPFLSIECPMGKLSRRRLIGGNGAYGAISHPLIVRENRLDLAGLLVTPV